MLFQQEGGIGRTADCAVQEGDVQVGERVVGRTADAGHRLQQRMDLARMGESPRNSATTPLHLPLLFSVLRTTSNVSSMGCAR
jgi:hypothetical protein